MVAVPDEAVLTVSDLTRRIRRSLEDEFDHVSVVGEVSNLRRPASGHVYLTLKDAEAQVAARRRELGGLAKVICLRDTPEAVVAVQGHRRHTRLLQPLQRPSRVDHVGPRLSPFGRAETQRVAPGETPGGGAEVLAGEVHEPQRQRSQPGGRKPRKGRQRTDGSSGSGVPPDVGQKRVGRKRSTAPA